MMAACVFAMDLKVKELNGKVAVAHRDFEQCGGKISTIVKACRTTTAFY